MPSVSKSRFKAHALEYMREVERLGRPLTITDRGRPVLEISPVRQPADRDWRAAFRGTITAFHAPLEPAAGEDEWESA